MLVSGYKIEKKIIRYYEIYSRLDEVDVKSRILKISGITIPVPEGILGSKLFA